jgi:hypothetical protein
VPVVSTSPELRSREAWVSSGPFLQYAATSWPYLGLSSSVLDDELLSLFAACLEGLSVLNWIHLLSDADELNHLAVASKAIHSFLSRKNREDSELLSLDTRSGLCFRLRTAFLFLAGLCPMGDSGRGDSEDCLAQRSLSF